MTSADTDALSDEVEAIFLAKYGPGAKING
jgi:hypothetical protein